MPPDAGGAGEARGGRGAKCPSVGTVAGDWAEMRVLQWFRGVRPQKIGLACGSEKVAKRILELLADGPMRPSALREAVGIRSRVHFSRCYMTPLVEKGLVARGS